MKKGRAKRSNDAKIERSFPRDDSDSLSANEIFTQGRALFIIVGATVLAYANSLSGAFVFDDTKQILGNSELRNWGNLFRAFTSDVWHFQRSTLTTDIPPPYYRPLFTGYLTLNYQLFGVWEPGWHLMNLLVHTVATVLIYFLLKKLSRDRLIATLGALVFGLHPAHVESVSWISGIPDPLCALFYVPSLLWYVRYREESARKWLIASVVMFGLAILCKETPLALLMVIGVWDLTRQKDKSWLVRLKNSSIHLVPYAIVAAGYLLLRFSVLGRISWKHPFMARVPDSAIWMTVPYVFLNYVKHLIAPFYLSLIYGTSFITSAGDPRFLLPSALLIGLGYVLWVYRKKLDTELWVAMTLFVAPLLPVLNLRVFHYEYIIQDRYLYLPSIGFCYLLAIGIARLASHQKNLAIAASAAIVLSFGASTFLQNRVWHDSVALWQRAIYYAPASWSTHYNLGLAYLGRKQNNLALTELTEAHRLNPEQATVLNNLALAQAGSGDVASAITNLRAALTLDPRLLEAHNNLGAFLYEEGDYAGAKQELLRVIQFDPASSSARFNLAKTLAATGDHAGAIREFESVLLSQPRDSEAHYHLGLSYAATGRRADAVREIQTALNYQRDPEDARKMQQKLEEVQRNSVERSYDQ